MTEWTGTINMTKSINRVFYLIKSGIKGIFTHGLMSFASVTIIMACLIIMGSFSLLVVNINVAIESLEAENEVVVFVDENLSLDEAMAMETELLAVYNVSNVEFMTRDEAMEIFMEAYPDSSYDYIDETVFRHRYIISLSDISLMSEIEGDLSGIEGVAKVSVHLEYAEAFVSVRNIISIISLVLVVILFAVSLLIMTNTIKLATFTRREEIAIMKMVGASNGFIRCPFIIEGLILGLVGGGLSFCIEWGLYELVCDSIIGGVASEMISVVAFDTLMIPMLVAYLAVSVTVGVVGGSTAIRNYLKV